MKIGSHLIPDDGVYVIAEISANHGHSYELACKTVEAIARSGANAVKLQTYRPDTITLDVDTPDFQTNSQGPWAGQSLYSLYEQAYTPWEWHGGLMKLANSLGLDLFSSPFDFTAVDFLTDLGVPAYKIASFEITDIPLIAYVASRQKPIIMSTGIADYEDIQLAVETCRAAGNNDIALLKCTSSYPAPIGEANLSMLGRMAKDFNVKTGLSDHTLGITAPVVAVAMGATIIEKHFILDRSIGGPDAGFSLNETEFSEMVRAVRDAEEAVGTESYQLTEKQMASKAYARSLYIAEDIKEGELFTARNVKSVRPGLGLHPKYLHEVVGQTATCDLSKGTRLSMKHYKN